MVTMNFMMVSNLFLILPVIAAAVVHEWLYFTFAVVLVIVSSLYHYLSERKQTASLLFNAARTFDWSIAIAAYIYMYYFIVTYVSTAHRLLLMIPLFLTIVFFWYGYKFGTYKTFHPWFHVFASIISVVIVLSI